MKELREKIEEIYLSCFTYETNNDGKYSTSTFHKDALIYKIEQLLLERDKEVKEELLSQMDISMEVIGEGLEVPVLLVNGEYISNKEELIKTLKKAD